MTDPHRFERVAELFETVRDMPTGERESYLRDHCPDDPALREEVERLLGHHDDETGALATPLLSTGASTAIHRAMAAPPPVPDAIGKYRIKEQIGVGGMGVVYLAEQDNPKREVAIKIIRPGVITPELLTRFDLETSMLGRLQHPGIAQILEAGTFDDGVSARPFFAMEYIDGKPLVEYAASHDLDTRARIGLFVRVCEAVHHAHQRGVLHRDIKPGNILVDASGQPKVLDFGVARATDSDIQAATLQTEVGRLLGTLPYMSPEQIAGDSDEVDTRSDVYSLGIVLYELLTGRLPYEAKSKSFVTLAKAIVEEAPISPAAVDASMRGDLSTIVLHAMEKKPERRYQSASGLAADIRRFLAHEPIAARPATAIYQASRFARRHVGFMAGLSAACLAVVVGVAGIAWQASRVRAEADTREQVAGFLREMLTSIEPEKTAGKPLTVRTLLDDASTRLDGRFADAPLVGADLHTTIGTTFRKLGVYDEAEAHHRQVAETYRDHFGLGDDRTLRAIASLAYAIWEQDRLEEAEVMLREALPMAREVTGPGARGIITQLAIVLNKLGRTDEAGALYHEIYDRSTRELGPSHAITLKNRGNLGQFLMSQGDNQAAAEHFEAVLSGMRALYGDDHPGTFTPLYNLGAAYCNLGRLEDGAALIAEAVERSERVLGPTHLHTLRRRKNLIRNKWQLGNQEAAYELSELLLRDCRKELGDHHAETIAALELHTTAIAFAGSMEDAETLALGWHARLLDDLGEEHRLVGRVAMLLVNLYESWDKPDQQAAWQERVDRSRYAPISTP